MDCDPRRGVDGDLAENVRPSQRTERYGDPRFGLVLVAPGLADPCSHLASRESASEAAPPPVRWSSTFRLSAQVYC